MQVGGRGLQYKKGVRFAIWIIELTEFLLRLPLWYSVYIFSSSVIENGGSFKPSGL